MASVEELQTLSRQIDEFFDSGREEEGRNLLETAFRAAQDNEAYLLFFEGEQAHYNGDDETARLKEEKATALAPHDPFLLKNYGVILSHLDLENEAIALFDKALAINPKDYHSLRQKGVSLSKIDRAEEAFALFDRALAINPKDYRSLHSKGVAFFNIGHKVEAYKAIRAAFALDPDNKICRNNASFIFSQLSDPEKATVAEETAGAAKPDPQNLGGLKGFIQTVRTAFTDDIARFEQEKEQNERHLREFITGPSLLERSRSIFLVLRKWNSYTPALPLDNGEKSLGGGYFIFHQECGTVIDPGYNFIENFHQAGCRLQDIDNIIITHAHNDHTIDFESLLTLLYQAHKEKEKSGSAKKVNLYLNQGSLLKFGSLLDWRARKSINLITTIHAGNTHTLNEKGTVVLTVLPAYHDEIVTRYYAVGLHFSFDFGTEGTRNLLLTSDTGLYPGKETINETEEERNRRRVEIHERYKVLNPKLVEEIDLLVPHLGSIGKKELKPIDALGLDKDSWQEEDLLYDNHLGVLGVLRMIAEIRPKVALISEFGEELKTFRGKLLELMQQVIDGVIAGKQKPRLLPADLPFIYDIKERTVSCVATNEMKPADQMLFEDEKGTFYYYCDKAKRRRFASLKDQYNNSVKPYLKSGTPSAAS